MYISVGDDTVAYEMYAGSHISFVGFGIAGWRVNEIGDYT